MTKKIGGLAASVTLLLIMTMCLFVCSCKKSPPAEEPQEPSEAEIQAKFDEVVKELEATAKEAEATAAEKEAEEAQAPEGDLKPIPLVLPKKVFIGTPTDIRVPNLEKPLGRPRPPFLAPEGTVNVAAGKPMSSTDEEPIIGEIEMITDGDKEAADGSYVELGPFLQHITVDLGEKHDIYAIVVWHYHKQAQVYLDVIVQIADDPDFITNVQAVFNNDHDNSAGLGAGSDMHYVETNEGKLIDAKGAQGRYVRLYSNGNSNNELNHYIEVEVYGLPAK